METDDLLETIANLQTTVDGLSDAVDSMSNNVDYYFSQLVGHDQGQQPQNGADNPTTTSTSPTIAHQETGAANITPPSFGGDNFENLFDNLTKWFEESIPSLIPSASAGEMGQNGGDNQFNMEHYLNRTRDIESGGNDNAVSPTGASGPFQFSESTWNDTKKRLAEQGHPEAADWTLQDRFDPTKAQLAAENLAEFNRTQLQRNVGGEIGEVETYSAHLLGAEGATNLLKADPNSLAKDSISEEALRANEGIFKGTGVGIDKLTAKQLIDSIAQFYGGQVGQRQPTTTTTGTSSSMGGQLSSSFSEVDFIKNSIKGALNIAKDAGVYTVGPEIGSNIPPNFAVPQYGMPPPRPMTPSPTTAEDSVNGVPNPSSNNPIFDFFNYFGVGG